MKLQIRVFYIFSILILTNCNSGSISISDTSSEKKFFNVESPFSFNNGDYRLIGGYNEKNNIMYFWETFSLSKWMCISIENFHIKISNSSVLFKISNEISVVSIRNKAFRFFKVDSNGEKININPLISFQCKNETINDSSNLYILENDSLLNTEEILVLQYSCDSEGEIIPDKYGACYFNLNGWIYNNLFRYINVYNMNGLKLKKQLFLKHS